MSRIHHNAIVITSNNKKAIEYVYKKADELFEGYITNMTEGFNNGYLSFLVVPDGSKEGWDTSNSWDVKRAEFIDWIETCKIEGIYSQPSPIRYFVEYVEVEFGNELHEAKVLHTNK